MTGVEPICWGLRKHTQLLMPTLDTTPQNILTVQSDGDINPIFGAAFISDVYQHSKVGFIALTPAPIRLFPLLSHILPFSTDNIQNIALKILERNIKY